MKIVRREDFGSPINYSFPFKLAGLCRFSGPVVVVVMMAGI